MRHYLHSLYFAVKGVACLGVAGYAYSIGNVEEMRVFTQVGLASLLVATPIFLFLDTIAARS